LSCHRGDSPQVSYERALRTFQHGDLIHSQEAAAEGYRRFSPSAPQWGWKFRILEAESLLWRGKYRDVLTLLDSPSTPSSPDDVVSVITLRAIAHARQLDLATADREMSELEKLCSGMTSSACGKAFQGRGLIALAQNRYPEARHEFDRSLILARSNRDRFLESTTLLNIGAVALKQEHFDEAIDFSTAALQIAGELGASDVALVAAGNEGWAYYKLGDREKARKPLADAEQLAERLGDVFSQGNNLTNLGYVYMDSGDTVQARQSFERALALAQSENSKEHMLNAQRVLARLALLNGDMDKAAEAAQDALEIARQGGNHVDELYPLLVQGQIASRRGDRTGAEKKFNAVEADKQCPIFLRWEAQHSLARLFENETRTDAADREYRIALATFESARADVRHVDFHLSFLTNGWRIYDDYIHFLIARGKTNDALRWADYSRARTLAEGLGLLGRNPVIEPPPLNPQAIAQASKGTILFYWLGEKQSYLWAITRQKTILLPLPAAAEVDAAVRRYDKAITGLGDVLDSANADGRSLYLMLVAPAKALLPIDGKVFIIPDGSLNNLNFETLLVPEPKLHYWVEDATVASASSLRVLAVVRASEQQQKRKLLLLGDSVPPNEQYPALPKAAIQMESVARHFAASERQVFQREQATPEAYLHSNPGDFSHIHFVAHGIASRLTPLDSAIVLSKSSVQDDSFKLYARDIIQHPLRAKLVTISACYGAGERAYSGEGLVGLSWAFLRAGAQNVVAALWEAADASSEQLMNIFYDELAKGEAPDAALRAAKLSLLRGNFRNPFYWAPFQLYRGGN